MAKRSKAPSAQPDSSKTAKSTTETGNSKPRRSLAQLEEILLQFMQAHAELAAKLAEKSPEKFENRLSELISDARVRQILKKCPGPLGSTTVAAVFRELVSGERAAAMSCRVAYLGPAHSYSHLAALRRFGHSGELLPVGSIASVFEEVASQQVQWGVVPIENSSDGRIVDTLEMFTRTKVQICGEVPLPIHHNLLGTGPRNGIQEICSKPQAISQCRDWLASHMPNARLTSTSSTTVAAERAAQDPSIAAIASREAGTEYGLRVLAKNIEDKKHNVTRFAVIGQDRAERTGNDKTCLMFELTHEPGALADAMIIFKRKGLNLTWIESFPKPNSPSEYLFFVELVGYPTDVRVKRALASLEKKTVRLEVIGAYPQ